MKNIIRSVNSHVFMFIVGLLCVVQKCRFTFFWQASKVFKPRILRSNLREKGLNMISFINFPPNKTFRVFYGFFSLVIILLEKQAKVKNIF
jgi:hypothetical protein